MPGYGRPAATAGCSGEVLARKRLPVQRRADGEASSRRSGVGQRQRGEARAEGVVVDQRDALLRRQGHVAADPVRRGRPAGRDRSGRAEPSKRTRGVSTALSASTTRPRSSVRTPEVPFAKPLASRTMAARTTSRGASGPAPCGDRAADAGCRRPSRRCSDAHPLAHADSGGDAVDAVGAPPRPLDHVARGLHASRASTRPRRARCRARRARPRRG